MSPLILIVASLHVSVGVINLTARPSTNLDDCRADGEAMIKAATAQPGSYASYVCHDTTGQTGLLGVVAYVKASDGKIKISEGTKPTLELCEAMGKSALATKVVPGAMSWMCYHLSSF
jgi:hypothetical protein